MTEATAMMSTVPSFSLTLEQATRLQGYVQTYRHYALTTLIPSTDRNNTLRVLQTIQGKIIEASDKKSALVQITFTKEEMKGEVRGTVLAIPYPCPGVTESQEAG